MSGLRVVGKIPTQQAPTSADLPWHLPTCPGTCTPPSPADSEPWRMSVCRTTHLLRTRVLTTVTVQGVAKPKGARLLAQAVLLEHVGPTLAEAYTRVMERHTYGEEPWELDDASPVGPWDEIAEHRRHQQAIKRGLGLWPQQQSLDRIEHAYRMTHGGELSAAALAVAESSLLCHLDPRVIAVYTVLASYVGWRD